MCPAPIPSSNRPPDSVATVGGLAGGVDRMAEVVVQHQGSDVQRVGGQRPPRSRPRTVTRWNQVIGNRQHSKPACSTARAKPGLRAVRGSAV